jgi:hypothetical protein
MQTDVRYGSEADLTAPKSNVRFTPESGLKADIASCPFCAISRCEQSQHNGLPSRRRSPHWIKVSNRAHASLTREF